MAREASVQVNDWSVGRTQRLCIDVASSVRHLADGEGFGPGQRIEASTLAPSSGRVAAVPIWRNRKLASRLPHQVRLKPLEHSLTGGGLLKRARESLIASRNEVRYRRAEAKRLR
jgi:hypothetical protein